MAKAGQGHGKHLRAAWPIGGNRPRSGAARARGTRGDAISFVGLPALKYLAVSLSFGTLALPVQATSQTGKPLDVPSGQQIFWQDMVTGSQGGNGLSYRFRFIAPDLAHVVPMTAPAPMEQLTDEDIAAMDALAAAGNSASIVISDVDAGLGSDRAPVIEIHESPASDLAVDSPTGDFVLPPAPESLLRDPMHDDIVWLCENFALPRIASPAPRPTEIIISLADRAVEGNGLEQGVVQLFEAFSLPPDRNECVWKPL